MSSSEDHQDNNRADKVPTCVATTGDSFCRPFIPRVSRPGYRHGMSNVFREACFSADGTTIVTHNDDHSLNTFPLPTDLLDESQKPHFLEPHSAFRCGSNIQSFDVYPYFDLEDPSTSVVLCAAAEVPITLRNAFAYDRVHAHYPFVNQLTEQHRPASCLAFTQDGRRFVAGSDNWLAVFDCYADGRGPVREYSLRPGRRALRLDTQSLTHKALVSALDIRRDGVLAIGTTQRDVGIYTHEGKGPCISTFSLQGQTGNGVTSIKWSPCGKYLLAAERQSDIVNIYDIRQTGQKLANLTGRNAKTLQRLKLDIAHAADGFEVWAGGMDGMVRMWRNPGLQVYDQAPDIELKMHDAPVTSAIWHPKGAVLATCSGERLPRPHIAHSDPDNAPESDSSEDEAESREANIRAPDNTLKVWNPWDLQSVLKVSTA